MKKGLRPSKLPNDLNSSCKNHCPDEEGIKTPLIQSDYIQLLSKNHCPDEEGIKTLSLKQ